MDKTLFVVLLTVASSLIAVACSTTPQPAQVSNNAQIATPMATDLPPTPTFTPLAASPTPEATPVLDPTPIPTINSLDSTPALSPTYTPRPVPTARTLPTPTNTRSPAPTPMPAPTYTPRPAPTPVTHALASQMKTLPWVADGVDETGRPVGQILDLAFNHNDYTFRTLLNQSSVGDRVFVADETRAIYEIGRVANRSPALAEELLTMPFLQTLEYDDILAIMAVRWLARYAHDGRLAAMMNHQTLEDGITDELTTLVAATGAIREVEEVRRMLNPGYADIEVHTGRTALSEEIKISIVRPHKNRHPGTMPEVVRTVNQIESLMAVPLPKPHMIFVFSDYAPTASANGISQGRRLDFAYALRGDREPPYDKYGSGRDLLPSVVIHEIGHDYYGNEIKSWLNHIPIKAGFEYIYRLDGRRPSETSEDVLNIIQRRACAAVNIQHLETTNPSSDRGQTLCHHYFAYWLGRELLEAVGEDEFMARMRRLYHMKNKIVAEGGEPGIVEIRELFPDQVEIVDRYWSGEVGSPEEKYWGGSASAVGDSIEHYFGCCCAGCVPTVSSTNLAAM